MKYHKIRNVDKKVCTVEQKIAYNSAFLETFDYREAWKASAEKFTAVARNEFVHDAVEKCLKAVKISIEYGSLKNIQFDIDAVFCCLNAGMENYFNSPYSIISSYEEIGKIFPAYYL